MDIVQLNFLKKYLVKIDQSDLFGRVSTFFPDFSLFLYVYFKGYCYRMTFFSIVVKYVAMKNEKELFSIF
jgi:hypothetical protein